jgi:hypothetical protein
VENVRHGVRQQFVQQVLKFIATVRRGLEGRYVPAVVACVAAVIMLPAIWFVAVVLLLTILYRQLMAPLWMVALAALLYTIDDSSYFEQCG